jgi:hypothetical protein
MAQEFVGEKVCDDSLAPVRSAGLGSEQGLANLPQKRGHATKASGDDQTFTPSLRAAAQQEPDDGDNDPGGQKELMAHGVRRHGSNSPSKFI